MIEWICIELSRHFINLLIDKIELFITGLYFNLGVLRKGGKELTLEEDPELAPKYVLQNSGRMCYLLENPYKNQTFSRIKFHSVPTNDSTDLTYHTNDNYDQT